MRQYQEVYFRPIRVGANAFAVKYEPRDFAENAILEKTKDLTLKLNAEDWFDVKKPIVFDVPVSLPKTAMNLYKQMERNLYAELDGIALTTANAATKTSVCLQIASGCAYDDESIPDFERLEIAKEESAHKVHDPLAPKSYYVLHQEKIEALREIVDEVKAPVLVAYQFRHECAEILKAFKNARVLDKNPQTIRDWNAGKIPILLAHPASCGHGLSLQDGGNVLVFFSTGWNLEEHEQIIERIGPTRQLQAGHDRPVFVYNLVANGTLDTVVQERLKTKRDVLEILMEKKHEQAL